MAEIIIIGSSSGDPSPDRANASLVLNSGNELYQFDAGEGFSSWPYKIFCVNGFTNVRADGKIAAIYTGGQFERD
jgi:ribonuclease BN (tRNA processing enzyme)